VNKPIPYADLYNLEEDKRIDLIGHRATDHKEVVGFMVDRDGEDRSKGDRYIAKLKAKFPMLTVMWRGDGPVDGVETIKIGVVN
jgi:hypothetical protein